MQYEFLCQILIIKILVSVMDDSPKYSSNTMLWGTHFLNNGLLNLKTFIVDVSIAQMQAILSFNCRVYTLLENNKISKNIQRNFAIVVLPNKIPLTFLKKLNDFWNSQNIIFIKIL